MVLIQSKIYFSKTLKKQHLIIGLGYIDLKNSWGFCMNKEEYSKIKIKNIC